MSSNAPQQPILYSYWRSSAAWRVRIALELKGIQYEYRARSDDYKKNVHPGGLVPALQISASQAPLTQSIAILSYLESLASPSLLPKDPLMEAHVLELVYTIACDTHPLQNLRVLHTYPEGDRPEHAKRIISSGLATFELLLGEQSGKCSVGDEVTWADIVLVPQVYNAQRWGVRIEQFPKISKIYGHLVTLPAFMAAHADNQPDAPKQ